MTVILILILASLTLALSFLIGFIWAVKSGQYEDTCTPSMRILSDDPVGGQRVKATPEPVVLWSAVAERSGDTALDLFPRSTGPRQARQRIETFHVSTDGKAGAPLPADDKSTCDAQRSARPTFPFSKPTFNANPT